MRRILFAFLLLATALSAATPPIDADRLLGHIKFLASDDLKGRASGSPELERAADYIAQQFRDIGLRPGGDDGTWFEPFQLIAGLTVGDGNSLVVSDRSKSIRLALGSTYYPLSAVPNESPAVPSERMDSLPLVFAGYGLSARDVNYDDYAGLDVAGKAVIIFSHEPQETDPKQPAERQQADATDEPCTRRPRSRIVSARGHCSSSRIRRIRPIRVCTTHLMSCPTPTRPGCPCCACAATRCRRCSTSGDSTRSRARSTAIFDRDHI